MMKLLHAKQALTSQGWQKNVTISVDETGHITNVKPNDECQSGQTYGIILPALSNVHSHSFQRAMAGLTETRGINANDSFWSWRKIMYQFMDQLTPEVIEVLAAQVQMEMLEAGYAAIGEFHYVHHDHSGNKYDDITELSVRQFAAANLTGIGYTHLPVLYMQGGLDGRNLKGGQVRFGNTLDEFDTLYAKLASHFQTLPDDYILGIAPHSLRAVTKDGLHFVQTLAKQIPIHIHIAEQLAEIDEVKTVLGKRPVQWLLDNINVDKRWCLIHATHMDKEETSALAKIGAVVGLCPITEANLGDGIFNATDYISQGGSIGIGSDSNVLIALSEEFRALETSQRLRDHSRVALSSAQTRSNGRYMYERAATGGAQALGRNSGEIKVGALADIVALDDTHHNIAGLSGDKILDAWLMASGDGLVTDVWSAGRHNVKGGKHKNHDQIIANFTQTMTRLRQNI
ncbi:MAG: formimidoylglutamate deiminase [Litorimonas sp.]